MEPPPRGDHGWRDGLNRKEHVAQVRRHPFVEVVGRDIFPAVAIVSCGVVDEDAGRPVGRRECSHRTPQRVDVAEIARLESHVRAGPLELGGQGLSALDIEIEKSYPRLLAGEGPDDLHADS